MPNPYLADEIAELTRSHKQAMERMHSTSREGGEQAVRAVQLWQTFLTKVSTEEATEAGMLVYAAALERWASAKTWEVQALDALALSLGTTREALLDELAALPPTFG